MAEDASNGGREPRVSYGLKELLQEIRDSVRAVDAKLDAKADRSTVDDINGRLITVESDVHLIKSERSSSADYRRWLVPLAITIILAAPQWLQAVGLS